MEADNAGRSPGGREPGRFGFSDADGDVSDRDISTAARAGWCVLLTGPSAEALRLARRIHGESSRGDGPFTVVDCADPTAEIVAPILEALGDAGSHRRPGPPPVGSLYLKDVGQMPLDVQRLLADLLARPGRSRVIASNPEPLLGRVIDGAFDDCLFYRLNVIHLVMPRSGEGAHFTV